MAESSLAQIGAKLKEQAKKIAELEEDNKELAEDIDMYIEGTDADIKRLKTIVCLIVFIF